MSRCIVIDRRMFTCTAIVPVHCCVSVRRYHKATSTTCVVTEAQSTVVELSTRPIDRRPAAATTTSCDTYSSGIASVVSSSWADSEADLGMFSMFGLTGAPTKRWLLCVSGEGKSGEWVRDIHILGAPHFCLELIRPWADSVLQRRQSSEHYAISFISSFAVLGYQMIE